MKDRLVTLIGGGGFVGRYVAQELLAAGTRVRIAQRDPRQAWFLKTLGGVGQVQFVAADVTRPETLARAVTGSDAVVNLVGILSGKFEAVQARGAGNVARAAADAGVSGFVQISAIGADPASPSAYGRSKAAGETAVLAAMPAATILRPSIIFGREDQFVNRFARMVAALPVVPVLRAETKFQPVYAVDVARAVVAALATPEAFAGKTVSIGGPDVVSMGDLVRWIARATGRDVAVAEIADPIGAAIALFGFLPGAPITLDQWQMLRADNVVPAGDPGIAAFGVQPVPMAAVAPSWLVQYRRHGRFGGRAAA